MKMSKDLFLNGFAWRTQLQHPTFRFQVATSALRCQELQLARRSKASNLVNSDQNGRFLSCSGIEKTACRVFHVSMFLFFFGIKQHAHLRKIAGRCQAATALHLQGRASTRSTPRDRCSSQKGPTSQSFDA